MPISLPRRVQIKALLPSLYPGGTGWGLYSISPNLRLMVSKLGLWLVYNNHIPFPI